MSRSFNKGEWSEVYAFIEVLSSGRLHAADENLNKIQDIYYTVLTAIKNDIEYIRDATETNIVFEYNYENHTIPISTFQENSQILINAIRENSSTFSIPSIEPFLSSIQLNSLKQHSVSKGDINLRIHDDFTGFEPVLSFSIKSHMGSNPTLLNASNGTILKYKPSIQIPINDVTRINSIEGPGKIKVRIEEINKLNIDLFYKDVPAVNFKENLQMIDYRLPEIISEIFLESYFVRGKRIPQVVQSYIRKHPEENSRIIEYKVKELLVAIALGMVPLTPWDGLDEATGGYIIVKENAEVLCYHIYERNKLKEYLYNHTKFDTPSTGRTNAGKIIYADDGSQEFNLTMHIRF